MRKWRYPLLALSTLPLVALAARRPVVSKAPVVAPVQAPDLGPNVIVFDATTPAATIQAKLDSLFASQERSEFGDGRYAVLFEPGRYDVHARVGFYTQISGLGLSPDAVRIHGGVTSDARWRHGNATLNFWRIAENLAITPDSGFDRWAVSQASPMRRVHVRGDLVLDDGGWSSGGFLADAKVDGEVRSGSQQQWLTRNSALGGWTGSNWNMVFVGTRNTPPQSFPSPPYTTVRATPLIREKPFLYVDAHGAWKVFVPALRRTSIATTWDSGTPRGTSLPIADFMIVKPGMSVGAMNEALARGRDLLLTPGIYHLEAPLRVARPHAIVLGLGLATLVADSGATAIDIADVDGATVAGLLIEAGPKESSVLMQVGSPGSHADHAKDPTLLADLFFRVGGADEGSAATTLRIESNDVIGDDLWLWRADHGRGVGWTANPAATGLVVDGADVTMYGLFVEHYQRHQVEWNGNGGRTYFFQNEMPYDVPDQSAWMDGATRGFDAYRVGPAVTTHEAWGLGSYCFFNRNPSVVAEHAFEAPRQPGVGFHDMVTVSLGGGKGTIAHVIDDAGQAAERGAVVQKLAEWP